MYATSPIFYYSYTAWVVISGKGTLHIERENLREAEWLVKFCKKWRDTGQTQPCSVGPLLFPLRHSSVFTHYLLPDPATAACSWCSFSLSAEGEGWSWRIYQMSWKVDKIESLWIWPDSVPLARVFPYRRGTKTQRWKMPSWEHPYLSASLHPFSRTPARTSYPQGMLRPRRVLLRLARHSYTVEHVGTSTVVAPFCFHARLY